MSHPADRPLLVARFTGMILTGLTLLVLSPRVSLAFEGLVGTFKHGAVVAAERRAVEVGADVLRNGGDAVDAAVATAFALAVTLPEAGNLGGGGFLVAFRAQTGAVETIDFREAAPLASTERMYLDPNGRVIDGHRDGPRAAGVPGTVRGLALAHQRHGRTDWSDLVEPARRLADGGFPVSEALATSLNAELGRSPGRPRPSRPGTLRRFASSIAAFARPDGEPWESGDQIVQADLAETLARIAEQGPDGFYRGRTADLIVQAMNQDGGIITHEDLRAYRAVVREPTHIRFRGFDIYGMAPPSSGGVVVGLALNILDRYDLKADGRDSARTVHRVTEAMRRAFYLRAKHLGDPDTVEIPTTRLLTRAEADRMAASIDDDRATSSEALAEFPILGSEGNDTTHISVVDAEGNAVALTYTLEQRFGSKYVVPGAGFLLNNEMGDFNLIPGRTDVRGRIGTPPNRIAPGKRMLSSQAPTLVLKDGRVRIVTGSPGGRTIPNTVLWVLLNLLVFEMEPETAVLASRTHHSWFPDRLVLEQRPGHEWSESTIQGLEQRNHRPLLRGQQGSAHTIVIDPDSGDRIAVSDPRRPDAAGAGH